MPVSKEDAKYLLEKYEPDPSKPKWLDCAQSSFSVRQKYNSAFLGKRLELPVETDEEQSSEEDEGSSDKYETSDDEDGESWDELRSCSCCCSSSNQPVSDECIKNDYVDV